jgi:hypothetical protein
MRVYFFPQPFVIGPAIGLRELVSTGMISSFRNNNKEAHRFYSFDILWRIALEKGVF